MNLYIQGEKWIEPGEYEPWQSGIDNSPLTKSEMYRSKGWLVVKSNERFCRYYIMLDGSSKNFAFTRRGALYALKRAKRKEARKAQRTWEGTVIVREEESNA